MAFVPGPMKLGTTPRRVEGELRDNRLIEANPMSLLQYRRWIVFILGWTALSLMFVPEVYLYFLYRDEPVPWAHTVALALANAAVAFLFLPPIIWLARRYPIEQATWRKAVAVHAPACLTFALSHSGLYALLCYASPSLFHALFVRFHPNLLTYWAVVGFTQAVDYFDRYRDRERRLAQAELLLMKAQLQPHFLFNTLHTISAMMREDVAGAERMIASLSDLLRLMLANIGTHEVPLRTELEFAARYVEIQKVRHGDRLQLAMALPSDADEALVPNMLLQPLVENAIRHGFDPRSRHQLRIGVIVAREGARLRIMVTDNGRGLRAGAVAEGVGLRNTRSRLRELYGDGATLTIGEPRHSGCAVVVLLPFHDSPSPEVRDEPTAAIADTDGYRRRRGVGAQAVARSA